MNCKDRLESYLRDNLVSFEIHHHPTAFTAQEVAASEHTPDQADLDRVSRVLGATEVRLAH